MDHILLPGSFERPLSFYLAMEEYVAAAIGCGFFVWRVPPTVIIGRNQDLESEVNLAWCRSHGVNIVRRKSGGGCVYADRGNIMVSYITQQKGVDAVFDGSMERFASFLSGIGLNAVRTEHNDILADGYKVSGNAFFVHPKGSIVHGTLLMDVDMDAMQNAITPSGEKLAKHAVASVRQRVKNISELGVQLSPDTVADMLARHFCSSARMLSQKDIEQIEAIQQSYLDPAFILGKAP